MVVAGRSSERRKGDQQPLGRGLSPPLFMPRPPRRTAREGQPTRLFDSLAPSRGWEGADLPLVEGDPRRTSWQRLAPQPRRSRGGGGARVPSVQEKKAGASARPRSPRTRVRRKRQPPASCRRLAGAALASLGAVLGSESGEYLPRREPGRRNGVTTGSHGGDSTDDRAGSVAIAQGGDSGPE